MNDSLEETSNVGVYVIVHRESGRTYVGQSNNIPGRWNEHIRELHRGSHHNHELQALWSQCGRDAFEFQVSFVAPDGLPPLETQRWLAQKEQEIYWNLWEQKKALNQVVPEIAETAAAFEEFTRREKDIEGSEREQLQAVNNAVTMKIRDVKSQLSDLGGRLSDAVRDVRHQQQDVNTARHLLWRNTGWRHFVLRPTIGKSRTELEQNLTDAEARLATSQTIQQKLESEEKGFREAQKDLYGSYPRNVERRLNRANFYSGLWSGIKRKSRIR